MPGRCEGDAGEPSRRGGDLTAVGEAELERLGGEGDFDGAGLVIDYQSVHAGSPGESDASRDEERACMGFIGLLAARGRERLGCGSRTASEWSGGGEAGDSEAFTVLFGLPEAVLVLLVEPAFGGCVEGDKETDGHFRANAGAAVEEDGKGLAADAKGASGVGNGQVEGFQAEGLENLAGM